MGGIVGIAWFEYVDIVAIDVTLARGDGDRRIDLDLNGAPFIIPGRGSFQSVSQIDEATGAVFYRDELVFTPIGADDQDALSVQDAFASASDDTFGVLAITGNLDDPSSLRGFILGYGFSGHGSAIKRYPVWMSVGSIATGTEHTDFNGPQMTFASVHPLAAAHATLNET